MSSEPDQHKALHSLKHHLRAALAVASIVTLLHGASVLGWLDSLMLRLVVGAGPAAEQRPTDAGDLPAVLLIGPELHETAFGQASPLDSAQMARLLALVPDDAQSRPHTVVIDLDLSPGPREALGDIGRAALDRQFERLVASGVKVVLPLPWRSATEEAQQRKFDWMRRLCGMNKGLRAPGLAFGLPDIVTHQGVVLQFEASHPSLSVVARDPTAALTLCRRALEDGTRWRAPLLAASFGNSALFEPARTGLRPFNARLFVAGDRAVGVARTLNTLPEDLPPLGQRALFVGAGYNPQDRFVVPVEGPGRPVEGVMVHAAIYDSMAHPVKPAEGLVAFLIDVVLGIGLGYVFAASWGWHQQVASANAAADTLTRLLHPRLSLLVNFALAGMLAALGVFVANRFLFPLNWWVNPGPIVLGLFAKFLLASRSGHADAKPANSAMWRLSNLDTLALVVLTLGTIVYLMTSEH